MSARHMSVFHYPPGGGWRVVEVADPPWGRVEAAIRRLDDRPHSIVPVSRRAVATRVADEGALDVFGGADAGYCVFENMGAWMFEDPCGSRETVRLWQSDQGYWCERRNLLAGVADVLRLARAYCDGGTCADLARLARDLTA